MMDCVRLMLDVFGVGRMRLSRTFALPDTVVPDGKQVR
jgi:hypothetical protein